MSHYNEDADEGDISLSFPISRASPRLSTIVRDDPSGELLPGPSRRGSNATKSSPLTGRDTGNGPNDRTAPPVSYNLATRAEMVSSGSTSTMPFVGSSDQSTLSGYLNDRRRASLRPDLGRVVAQANEANVAGDERDMDTPRAKGSFWGIDDPPRPSSADPRARTDNANGGSETRPMARRTSSNATVGRSRSLNLHVRLPSYDLSGATGGLTPKGKGKEKMPSSTVDITPTTRLGWSRSPGDLRAPPLVDEVTADRMSRWIKEIVICNFDLERGPVVERRVMGRRWGPGQKENVAFSSFPDTSLFTEGSIVFSFKIRHIPPDPSTMNHPEPLSPMPDTQQFASYMIHEQSDATPTKPTGGSSQSGLTVETPSPVVSTILSTGEKAEEYRKWDERGREWLYGFVWFEQRKDRGIARGYMQKSLVILSHLPFPSLFSAILDRVAPVFFEHGYSALEAACHSIASWPDPRPDQVLELPLMSNIITVKLPDTRGYASTRPGLSLSFTREPTSLPSSTPLRTFAPFLPSLWSIWECLVLAEPILIIAPDPRICSEIVWWLRDLLRPFPPSGDFRPYLHIHDHDFSLLVNSNKPQAGVVVGVTNPFFRNAAAHWPNVISISPPRPTRYKASGSTPTMRAEQPEGFISRRHRSVSKDRTLLKRLEALAADGQLDDPAGNEALRTHFQQLSERMLVPLNRYFQTLVPTLQPSPIPSPNPNATHNVTPSTSISSMASFSSTTSTSSLRPFSLPAFLSHLKKHGPNPLAFRTKGLTSKSRVESDFYASFCMSATFAGWLSSRVESLGIAVAAQTADISSIGGLMVPQNDATPTKSRSGSLVGQQRATGHGTRGPEEMLTGLSIRGIHDLSGIRRARAGSVDGRISTSDASTASTDWREGQDSSNEI